MNIWLTTKKQTSGLRLNLIRCSLFDVRCLLFGHRKTDTENRTTKTKQRKPNIENQTSKTEHRKPNIENRSSSLFRQGESPTGFSYWCNKAKAETRSLGFSDFMSIFISFPPKTSNII